MTGLFLIMLFALSYQAFLNGLMFMTGAHSSFLLAAPIVLILTIFCTSMLSGLLLLPLVGMLLDALTGTGFGQHMIWMVLFGFTGMLLSSWLGKPHWPLVFSFLVGASLIYRLWLSQMGNWGLWNLLFGPLADAFLGMIIFQLMPARIVKMD